MNIFKWLYDKGYERGLETAISELVNIRQYSELQSELAYYKKDEKPNNLLWKINTMTPKEHMAAANAMSAAIRTIVRWLPDQPDQLAERNEIK